MTSHASNVPRIDRRSVHRRDKAPPPFSGESEALRIDDWLPALERAATWNEWGEDDRGAELYRSGRC